MTVYVVLELFDSYVCGTSVHSTQQRAEVRAMQIRTEYPDQTWVQSPEQSRWCCDELVVEIRTVQVDGIP